MAAGKKSGKGGWFLFWLAFFIGITLLFTLNLERIKGTLRETKVLDRLVNRGKTAADEETAPELDFRIRELTVPEWVEPGQAVSNGNTAQTGAVQTGAGTQTGTATQGVAQTGTGTQSGVAAQTGQTGAGQSEPPLNQGKSVERSVYLMKVDSGGAILWTPVKRDLPASDRPLQDTLEQLIRGPSALEEKQGFISLIPKDVKILNAVVRGSTAYISFNENFLFNTYGVEGYAGQRNQIVLTATEFNNVKDVQILIDGKRIDYLGEGVWIGSPISRNML